MYRIRRQLAASFLHRVEHCLGRDRVGRAYYSLVGNQENAIGIVAGINVESVHIRQDVRDGVEVAVFDEGAYKCSEVVDDGKRGWRGGGRRRGRARG